jgi:crotonobetainyl-CoA:carnitine CoA-transferase CaiB-like acyl-CoA transferase
MLEGLKVVEFATYVAGPSAAAIMADWGADVIKVESRTGDPVRHIFAAFPELSGNPVFEFENRGKRGVVVDIATAGGRAALIEILRGADIFITNLRSGSLARNRLDYASLREELPGLIYCSVSGYGLEGDHIDKPAFDIAALWTRSGLAAVTIPEGVEPFQSRPGTGDAICALATASAALAAVVEKARTGKGRLVETSLMRAGVYAIGWDMSIQLKFGRWTPTAPRARKPNPASNYFRTREGRWIVCLTRGPTDWADIARAAGCAAIVDDPRFSTPEKRLENGAALLGALEGGFGAMSMDEAAERLTALDVMWAPLQTPDEVAQDPYAHAAGCFVPIEDAGGEAYLSPASPARFPGARDAAARPAPPLGAHTRDVLREAGLSAAAIDALLAAGDIYDAGGR